MVPAWQASSVALRERRARRSAAYPVVAIGYEAKNNESTLIGHVPARTSSTPSRTTSGRRSPRSSPSSGSAGRQEAFGQFDQAAAVVGGFDGAFGWWGDAGRRRSRRRRRDDRRRPPDPADGRRGGQAAVRRRSAASSSSPAAAPASRSGRGPRRRRRSPSSTFQRGRRGAAERPCRRATRPRSPTPSPTTSSSSATAEAFVAVGPRRGSGPVARRRRPLQGLLVKRVGAENIGRRVRRHRRRSASSSSRSSSRRPPAEQWAVYEREVRPYLLPLDAFVSGRPDRRRRRPPDQCTAPSERQVAPVTRPAPRRQQPSRRSSSTWQSASG